MKLIVTGANRWANINYDMEGTEQFDKDKGEKRLGSVGWAETDTTIFFFASNMIWRRLMLTLYMAQRHRCWRHTTGALVVGARLRGSRCVYTRVDQVLAAGRATHEWVCGTAEDTFFRKATECVETEEVLSGARIENR